MENEPETKLDMALRMLEEARADVVHADHKAGLILAALGVGFGAVLGGQLAAGWDSGKLSIPGQALWWAGVVLAVFAVASSALAVWPRYKLDDEPDYGITYWGHAAAFDNASFLQAALEEQAATNMARTAHQLWRVSRLVLVKYRSVRAALIFASASALLLGLAAVVVR